MKSWIVVSSILLAACDADPYQNAPQFPQGHGEGEPPVEWHVGLGTAMEEHVHEGMATLDGGYIAIGHTAEREGSGATLDILIVKTDATGAELWQRRVGESEAHDVGIAIAETTDGYVAGGGLQWEGRQQRVLMKFDLEGELVWQQVYPNEGVGAVRGIEVLADGSIVSTGYVQEGEEGFLFIAEGRGFLLKTDAAGEVLWDRTLEIAQGTKLRTREEGGFTILSTDFVDAVETTNVGFTHTDAMGIVEETRHYGGNNEVQAFDFDDTADGGFVFAGHTLGYGVENWDCLMGRVDAEGELLWTKVFGQPRGYDAKIIHDECYGIRSTPDGGVVMAGGTGDEVASNQNGHPSGPSSEWKNYVVRTDGDGEMVWTGVYGDGAQAGNNAAEYLALTEDGGFILFTDSDSVESEVEPNHFGFMKLGPEE